MTSDFCANRKLHFAYLTLAALLLSGCGAEAYSRKPAANNRAIFAPSAPNGSGSGNGGNAPIASPSPAPAGAVSTGIPPITLRVGAVGYTATTVTVLANKVLKAKFSPGVQDETIAGTGYSPPYSMLGVYIGIGSNTSPTEMLLNGLNNSSGAQTSHVFDLSQSFSKTCPSTDPTCRQQVQITIEKPSNDFFCLTYQAYCPWGTVYSSHPWHGTLTIQTDDTDPI